MVDRYRLRIGTVFYEKDDGEFVKHDDYAALLAERDALAAKVAAMSEDVARLDWLDRLNATLNKHYGTTYKWKLTLSPMIVRLWTGRHLRGFVGDVDLNDQACGKDSYESCRIAIDAARQEFKP